jgi:two-component system sensor histidine kinase BaeS
MHRRHTLRSRITLVTVLVAVVAVLTTGLISLQFVRSSTSDSARAELAAQAELLTSIPKLATTAGAADRAELALGDTLVAIITPTGTLTGDAAQYVDKQILTRLTKGNKVSTVHRGASGTVLIEARSTKDGGFVILALPQSSVEGAVGAASARALIALAIGLALALIGGTVLARLIARPLTATAAVARRLAAGERGVQMPETRTAEVADVTDALETLDAALVSSESRQREFLLSISHELRTPLTAVRGYAEAMADGLIAPDQLGTVGNVLIAETERLDNFVGDLLELARLEADDFSISLAVVDLPSLLRDVTAAWLGRAATLGVLMVAQDGEGSVTTDSRRLRQVIDGLVENAMRVTPSGATIEIASRREGSATVIEVLDGGPGLTDDDLTVAFERGVLRARYRDIRPVGTGLGLSIAARLVARLGGSIRASNRPGGGAAFSVRLP